MANWEFVDDFGEADMEDHEPSFSIDDFRKWLFKEQPSFMNESFKSDEKKENSKEDLKEKFKSDVMKKVDKNIEKKLKDRKKK